MQSRITHNGFFYFKHGIKIITLPGLKRFIIIPLVVNMILFGSMSYWLFYQLSRWITSFISWLPDWLQWLDYIIWPLSVLSIIFVLSYFFSTVANFIASPFNGLLAERVEVILTGQPLDNVSYFSIIKDIPRMMKKEWHKLMYYLLRALLLFAFSFIPVIGQVAAPIMWFLFGSWMMSVQYCDYPFDNHKIEFRSLLATLKKDKIQSVQFGSLIYLLTLIPIVNLFIMPIAICGATSMWVDRYRIHFIN